MKETAKYYVTHAKDADLNKAMERGRDRGP